MSEQPPKLAQLNLLVEDMAASLDFYRRLGLATADEEGEPHVELSLPDGLTLELDTVESAGLWHAGIRADPASARGARVVIGFSLPSREAVDTAYAELTAAGYQGRQPPFDAFWGGRYAIVADPSGNDVGLMSPIDESMRSWSWPPEESPA
jgi:catechol 2,3-dioxygenase-like lactoylglutathione lyase family enzyme